MERIPSELFLEILKFLSLKEIFVNIIRLNSWFKQTVLSLHLLQYLVKREHNLRKFPNTPASQSYKVLKSIKKKPGLLEFIGFITNGGVDENMMRFWCRNLFRSEGEAYCSYDDAYNCNIGGVLKDSLVDPRTYFNSVESVKNCIQDYLNGKVLDEFLIISLIRAMNYLGMDKNHSHLISQLEIEASTNKPLSLQDVRRVPLNDLLLQQKLDLFHSETSEFYAVVKQLKISRKGYFTCPVKTLMVFISESFIDVTSNLFSVYDDLRTYEDIENLINREPQVPGIFQHFRGLYYEYCEFIPGFELELVPILWIDFDIYTVSVNLNSLFTGKYVYVKLMHPQDKREGRHQGINIDCRYVLPYGNIINLGQEY